MPLHIGRQGVTSTRESAMVVTHSKLEAALDFATIVSSLLNATGRIGLTIALTALTVFGMRYYGVELAASMPREWVDALVIAGIFGGVVAGLSALVWVFGKAVALAKTVGR